MKLKKLIAAAMVTSMTFAAAPILAPTAVTGVIVSEAEAARGGVRMAPRSAPAAPKAAPQAGSSKSVSGNGNSYTPSKSANQLDKSAPAAGTRANTPGAANAASTTQRGTGWGNALRSVGLLAGGMLLGSMLASMFGLGEGFLADLLGVLANVAMVMVAFMVLRWLWNRFRSRKEENVYQSAARPEVAAPRAPITDIRPPGADKTPARAEMSGDAGDGARTIADRYRNR